MAYSVIFAGAAQRQFDKLPKPAQQRLVEPEQDDERASWAGLSLSGLAGAYGEDEPDYGPADVKRQ